MWFKWNEALTEETKTKEFKKRICATLGGKLSSNHIPLYTDHADISVDSCAAKNTLVHYDASTASEQQSQQPKVTVPIKSISFYLLC